MYNGFCLPDKAQYLTGDSVRLTAPGSGTLNVTLYRLHEIIETDNVICETGNENTSVVIGGLPTGSYGAVCEREGERYETAFDIVDKHSDITRYGFLTGFTVNDEGTDDIESMTALHINAVQFYDWMYRHDDLVYDGETYADALGKETSRSVIMQKINACKERGMRPFAYGAVYASSAEGYAKHPDWGMYTLEGRPLMFGEWLYYMDISPDCGWHTHIINEFKRAADALGFSGIHMDTYGFPKRVWNSNGKPVELARHFQPLINAAAAELKKLDESNGVIFNAVNNWPIEAVARSAQDAVYIEVWPPHIHYIDLYNLIRRGKELSGKPVVLAAYMEPFKDAKTDDEITAAETAYLLANAVICASGGTQLALGENQCILCDSYYVNHARLRDSFLPSVRRYADFTVRYAQLLYNDKGTGISMTGAGGINEDYVFNASGIRFSVNAEHNTVWTIIRESAARVTINLINLLGSSAEWNKPKNAPSSVEDITLRIRLDREITGVYTASPDNASAAAEAVPFTFTTGAVGRVYTVWLPGLTVWSLVWIENKI
jgi:dextranase